MFFDKRYPFKNGSAFSCVIHNSAQLKTENQDSRTKEANLNVEGKYLMKSKLLAAFLALLLFTGAVYAFPYDPNPSEIDGTLTALGTVITPSSVDLFPGSWSNQFHRGSAQTLRLHSFMIDEFNKIGGPGGTNDLNIWNTPSFNADKMLQQNRAWAYAIANPGSGRVPVTDGLNMYTTHDELVSFIETNIRPTANVTVEYLGEIPRGFPFPVLIFSKSKDRSPAGLQATGLPLVWVQGNIHGGEWSGGEGALSCAYDLARGKYDNLLEKVNVIVVPRVTADGAKVPIRSTNDLTALQWTPNPEARDLNRDNVLLDHHVTRAMRKLNMAYRPHFAIDLHERLQEQINAGATSFYGVKFDYDPGDISAGGTTILQTPKELTHLRYKYLEPDLRKYGEQYGIYMGYYHAEGTDNYSSGLGTAYQTWNNYVPHSDDVTVNPHVPGPMRYGPYSGFGLSFTNGTTTPGYWMNVAAFDPDAPYLLVSEGSYNHRSSRNINSMPGVISQLFENRSLGSNIGTRGMFERRVAAGYVCVISTIYTAADRGGPTRLDGSPGDNIVKQLDEMRARWIEKGKTYDPNDMIPILTIQNPPTYLHEIIDKGDGFPYDRAKDNMPYWGIDIGTTDNVPNTSADDIVGVTRFDLLKSIKKGAHPTGGTSFDYGGELHHFVTDGTGGDNKYQPIKVEVLTQGWNLRERPRPTAYIFEGPYAAEVAGRMLIAGIDVKRLAKDTTLNVVGWSYQAAPSVDFRNSGGSGWGANNRNVKFKEIPNRKFEKDSYVVFLGQLMNNLIPMYMEPDMPFSAGNGIMLTYMSVALGGASSGSLSPNLVGVEMPIYRYIGDPNTISTYDLDFFLPLINRGAVPRFFSYPTPEEVSSLAATVSEKDIKVYDYDIQVHARPGQRTTASALKDGKFDMALPTSELTDHYLILKNDGTYEKLTPHSSMLGWNVATIVVANHGNVPFTVDIASNGRPAVGDGSNRTLPVALPAWDDLIGVRIIEVVQNEILSLFKNKQLPQGAVLTDKGIEYTEMFTRKEVLLSNSMLDGWSIVEISPQNGKGWEANIVNGEIVVKFTGEAYDEVLTVKLAKTGNAETKEIEIKFSGESWWDKYGCNAGFAFFAVLAFLPVFLRRK